MIRRFLAFGFIAIALLSVLSCSGRGPSADSPAEASDLRRFEGTQLVFIANKHPWIDLIEPRIERFTEQTGISVRVDVYPEEQFRTKRLVEMVSGVSQIDLFMIMPGNSLDAYLQAGWVADLSPFLEDSSLAWPGYDQSDLFPTALQAGRRGDKSYVLPIMLETSLLAYNREILDLYDQPVPTTMEELESVAAAIFTASGGRTYGITMRGKRGAATSQWIDFVRSYGGDWLTSTGDSALREPDVLAATRFYGRLLREYGPPSAPSNGWYESTALFMQGRAAMVYDANVFKSNYENDTRSMVAGKVGYRMIPSGPAGSKPHVSSWGLSIYEGSEHKDAAWYFIQWATGKGIASEGLMQGIPAARRSAWEDPAYRSRETSEDWIEASLESFGKASTMWNPPVVDVAGGREIAGALITTSILGGDLDLAARRAATLMNDLMKMDRETER